MFKTVTTPLKKKFESLKIEPRQVESSLFSERKTIETKPLVNLPIGNKELTFKIKVKDDKEKKEKKTEEQPIPKIHVVEERTLKEFQQANLNERQ